VGFREYAGAAIWARSCEKISYGVVPIGIRTDPAGIGPLMNCPDKKKATFRSPLREKFSIFTTVTASNIIGCFLVKVTTLQTVPLFFLFRCVLLLPQSQRKGNQSSGTHSL
jgi:hypothetical protein